MIIQCVGNDLLLKASTSRTIKFVRVASSLVMLATEVKLIYRFILRLKTHDSIFLDSGGPIMRFRDNWIIEGIVSFGYLCGLQDWPAIYTKVSAYTEWIDRHMKP